MYKANYNSTAHASAYAALSQILDQESPYRARDWAGFRDRSVLAYAANSPHMQNQEHSSPHMPTVSGGSRDRDLYGKTEHYPFQRANNAFARSGA